jgi:hypothetical protein
LTGFRAGASFVLHAARSYWFDPELGLVPATVQNLAEPIQRQQRPALERSKSAFWLALDCASGKIPTFGEFG